MVFGSRPLTGSLVLGMFHPRLLIDRRAVAFVWHRTKPSRFPDDLEVCPIFTQRFLLLSSGVLTLI